MRYYRASHATATCVRNNASDAEGDFDETLVLTNYDGVHRTIIDDMRGAVRAHPKRKAIYTLV